MGLSHAEAELEEVCLHYVTAGHGPPVVLLHGWPQTWYEWSAVIAAMADEFSLIAPDLRGLGDSSVPASGYDINTVAADIHQLVRHQLGHARYAVIGHDWGGPVAFALAASNREAVSHLAVIDAPIPVAGITTNQGGRRWHHQFHQTDLPETLVRGREADYLGWFYEHYGASSDAISEAAKKEYLRSYTQADHLHAGFEYYRNIATDTAQIAAHQAQGLLDMPVLALGGGKSFGRGEEVLESCRHIANDVRGGVINNAGHWIPEEAPEELCRHIRALLATGAS